MNFNQMPRFKPHQFQIVALITEWAVAFQVDAEAIERQIPIAHAWANANPRRAPKKDPVRFLHNWMSIAKRSGSLNAKHEVFKEKAPDDEVMTGDDFARMREAIKKK